MNSQVLGDKGKDYMAPRDMKFKEFWNGESDTIEAILAVWKLKISIQEEEQLLERGIRRGTKERDKTPDTDVLRTLFLAIFQNAFKHGVKESGNERTVNLYMEGDNLCISNIVEEKEKDKIEKNISPDSYRIGEGISQAVIFDICQSWYLNLHYDKMFVIEEEDASSKKWAFVVKLPILERRNEK